ncbi:MAG: hypothetical protein WBW33_28065 [Bryobacteraceae bacterium]
MYTSPKPGNQTGNAGKEKAEMYPNKLTQGLLILAVLLLSLLAIRPNGSSTNVQAEALTVQYKVVEFQGDGFDAMEQKLNALGKDGWSLVTCANGFGHCILKK